MSKYFPLSNFLKVTKFSYSKIIVALIDHENSWVCELFITKRLKLFEILLSAGYSPVLVKNKQY